MITVSQGNNQFIFSLEFLNKRSQKWMDVFMKLNYIYLINFQSEPDLGQLARCKDLKIIRLDAQNSHLTKVGLQLLQNSKHPCLKELNLSQNLLNCQAMNSLCKLIKNNDIIKIKCLNLRDNPISNKGLQRLVRQRWTNLMELHLCKNGLTNTSLIFLLQMELFTLKRMNLSFNKITNDGIKIMTKFRLPLLNSIILECNPISDDGLKWLSLTNFPILRMLSILRMLPQANLTMIPSVGGIKQMVKRCQLLNEEIILIRNIQTQQKYFQRVIFVQVLECMISWKVYIENSFL